MQEGAFRKYKLHACALHELQRMQLENVDKYTHLERAALLQSVILFRWYNGLHSDLLIG